MLMPSCVAFIPARSGSKRVPDKNIRSLHGHPLLAYSVRAALDSGVYERVVCATDSESYAEIASAYGAEVPFLRPAGISGDTSPDIAWVRLMLEGLAERDFCPDCFSILRPTSPFRNAETIRRAWKQFVGDPDCDSLRAVELCAQHPAKMWRVDGARMQPVLKGAEGNVPWHSCQYASLPPVYVQNASLEIAWTRVTSGECGSISGDRILPFFTERYEGVDVNSLYDWDYAEKLVEQGKAKLPEIGKVGICERERWAG
jgi:CMP-N,N'-diacetyllegionaminic acid synthase